MIIFLCFMASGLVVGTQKVQTPKSGDMVQVPAGEFMMGCNGAVDNQCREDEKPYNKGNGNTGNGGNGSGNNGNGRATPKQLKAIFAIAQDKNISNKEVRDLCVDEFGKTPD
jgi:hypothetical protein